ncbi:MAG TPA: hypothetical protein VNH46_13910 [Gemmatimonadales bacterium]|nr:hypothetical protein [Gemmatimonadales bacterium]
MTLPLARTQVCARCRGAIRPGDAVVRIPDFIADERDPLWRFTDGAMHEACFATWPERKALVARFNRVARVLTSADGTRQRMDAEGRIHVEAPVSVFSLFPPLPHAVGWSTPPGRSPRASGPH